MSETRENGAHTSLEPSAWVRRFAALVPTDSGEGVLDVAAGAGRHSEFFLQLGHRVTAVDRDVSGLGHIGANPRLTVMEADLERGEHWPLENAKFAGVIVINYLHRPILDDIVTAVVPGGALIYETFAAGNERFGHPRNPDFLLRNDELLEAVRDALTVVAYEHGQISEPRPAIVQRIAAVRLKDDELASRYKFGAENF